MLLNEIVETSDDEVNVNSKSLQVHKVPTVIEPILSPGVSYGVNLGFVKK